MLNRYYLIPFETDQEKMTYGLKYQPKHMELITTGSQAIQPKLTLTKDRKKIWYRDYFIIRVPKETEKEYAELESHPDVLRLDKDTELTDFQCWALIRQR